MPLDFHPEEAPESLPDGKIGRFTALLLSEHSYGPGVHQMLHDEAQDTVFLKRALALLKIARLRENVANETLLQKIWRLNHLIETYGLSAKPVKQFILDPMHGEQTNALKTFYSQKRNALKDSPDKPAG